MNLINLFNKEKSVEIEEGDLQKENCPVNTAAFSHTSNFYPQGHHIIDQNIHLITHVLLAYIL